MPIPLAFTKLLRSFESCAEAVEKLVIFRKGCKVKFDRYFIIIFLDTHLPHPTHVGTDISSLCQQVRVRLKCTDWSYLEYMEEPKSKIPWYWLKYIKCKKENHFHKIYSYIYKKVFYLYKSIKFNHTMLDIFMY